MARKTIAFRCPDDLRAEITARAAREGRSKSEVLCDLLQRAISNDPTEGIRDQIRGLEDSVGDLHLNLSEQGTALAQLGKQIRTGFEAALLNLAPDQSSEEIAAWIRAHFPPISADGQE